jgi:hypothetical protein
MKSLLTAFSEFLACILIAFCIVAWVYIIADIAVSGAIRKHEQFRHAQPEPAQAPAKV